MDYTILLDADTKQLHTTKYVPTFEDEKQSVTLKLVIPLIFTDMIPTVHLILPDGQQKFKVCDYLPDIYKEDFKIFYVDVPANYAAKSGVVQLWLSFLDNSNNSLIKSDILPIHIDKHVDSGYEGDNGDFTDITSQLITYDRLINELKNEKIDNIGVENNTLILKSGDNELSRVDIPEEVNWDGWNETRGDK